MDEKAAERKSKAHNTTIETLTRVLSSQWCNDLRAYTESKGVQGSISGSDKPFPLKYYDKLLTCIVFNFKNICHHG